MTRAPRRVRRREASFYMRAVIWNVRRALPKSDAWTMLNLLNPDVALLQEVSGLPEWMAMGHDVVAKKATSKSGAKQRFSTAVVARHPFRAQPTTVRSSSEQINDLADGLEGNLVFAQCETPAGQPFTCCSVYSPAWPVIDRPAIVGDLWDIKLTQNSDLWLTEVLYATLRDALPGTSGAWMIGGDFNSSETFDTCWGSKPRGNLEIMRRPEGLGLRDALRHHKGALVPTFRTPRGGKVLHQLDHLYVSPTLLEGLLNCDVSNKEEVFGRSISDHLPIVADFDLTTSAEAQQAALSYEQ